MENRYKIPTAIAILSAIMGIGVFLDEGHFKTGLLINKIIPCETPMGNSFPCYGLYSIYLFLFLFVIFALSTGYVLELRKRQKENLPVKPASIIIRVFLRGVLISILTITTVMVITWLTEFITK